MRSRLVLINGTATVLLLLAELPVLAGDGAGWTEPDEDEGAVDVGAEDGTEQPGSGGTAPACAWEPYVPADEWGEGPDPFDFTTRPPHNEYDWYWKACPKPDGTVSRELVAVPREPPAVDPVLLREQVIDRLQLPSPTVAMNPPGDQVVHVETWLWIDDAIWRTHSKSVTAGGVTVTATASPQRVVWDMGNGDAVVCTGPGTAYDASRRSAEQSTDCSYTYARSSAGQPSEAYVVTTTIEWDVSWSVVGAVGGGPLPALVTSSSMAARVAEMQALNQ
ncbi:MAG TPA: hypothetical protein VGA36_10615 [Nitriliruptorales bacterium]